MRETQSRLVMDKCDAHYTFKLPSCLKDSIDKLSDTEKRLMKERILVVMARSIHDSNFDPTVYLNSD